jgi:hypothetical protein
MKKNLKSNNSKAEIDLENFILINGERDFAITNYDIERAEIALRPDSESEKIYSFPIKIFLDEESIKIFIYNYKKYFHMSIEERIEYKKRVKEKRKLILGNLNTSDFKIF